MAHRPAVKTQGLASFGVGPGIASRGCDLPAPDIRLPLPALISPQRGVLSDPFNSSSSIITCKVVILNQYTYNLFLQVLTFPLRVAKTLTNMAANKWFRKFSTNSLIATAALLMFAEYMKFNAVSPCPFHIAGTSNVVADDISRVHEMFTPHLDSNSAYKYPSLIRQV